MLHYKVNVNVFGDARHSQMMSEEQDMVAGVRAGDAAAVARLVETHSPRLLRSAVLLCGCEADAHDAVQETLVTALRLIGRFRGASSLYTWLHGILINVVRHTVRARKLHAPLEDVPEPADHRCPGDDCARTDEARAVRAAVAALPPEYREVVVLRYFEEMKVDDIARQLGLRSGTVKSRLHYAAARLRAALPPEMQRRGE